jgi:predicted nucleotidyltransferase
MNMQKISEPVLKEEGNKKTLYIKRASDTLIRRHIKVKAEANPFETSTQRVL